MYKIDFNHPIHVHFIGIGGISMSGLAEILLQEHFTISGLFYFRLGGIDNEFFFYMAFLLLAKYMPNFVIIKKNGSVI